MPRSLPGTDSQFSFQLPPKPKPPKGKKPPKPVVLTQSQYNELPDSAKKGKGLTPDQYSKLSSGTRMAISGGFLGASKMDKAVKELQDERWREKMRQGTREIEARMKAREDQRKREAMRKPISMGLFSLPSVTSKNIRSVGQILNNAAGDFPEMGRGLAALGKTAGSAALSDLRTGRGLIGLSGTFNPIVQGYRIKEGTFGQGLDPRGKRSEFDRISEPIVRGIPASYAELAKGESWKNDPVMQLLNLGSVAFPATRIASIGKLSKAVKAENAWMTSAQAMKAGLIESYRPGLLAANGIKGGIPQRLIKGTKTAISNPRPTSRSPWGRAGQQAFEGWSTRRAPGSRWGGDARIMAAQRRAALAAQAAKEAAWKPTIDTLIEGVKADGPTGFQKIKEAFAGIQRVDPERGAVVAAALQGPKGLDIKEAGNRAVQEMGARLHENQIHRQTQDAIDSARQQIDEIDSQMEEIVAAVREDGLDPSISDELLGSLRERRQAIRGVMRDQIEQLDFELGRRVHPVRDSPQRDAVYQTLVEQFGKKQAAEKIRYMDAIARAIEPDMPQRWYHQVSVQRARTAEGLVDPLFQRRLPDEVPQWEGNPYRLNRLRREQGLPEEAPPFEFEDAPGTKSRAARGGAASAGTVKPIRGATTLDDRLKRIESNISPEDAEIYSRWYESLWDWFAFIYGPENARAVGNAFLASQAALSPAGGVGVVNQVADVIRSGKKAVPRSKNNPSFPSIHGTADNIFNLLLGNELGVDPNMIKTKLSDFFDSAYGRQVRRMMGDESYYGGPGVVDRWTMRSDGFIDSEMKTYVKKVLGKDPNTFKYDNITSPKVYEFSSKRLNDLTAEANRKKLFGRDDWEVDQIQALDWFATRKEFNTKIGDTEEIGGWRGAIQENLMTVTAETTGRMRREALEKIVRNAGGSIPPIKNFVESQGSTVAVTFAASADVGKKVAKEVANLSGGWAYHIYPSGMTRGKTRAPILTVTGTPDELRAAQVAVENAEGTGNPLLLARDDGFDLIFIDQKGDLLATPAPLEEMVAKAQEAMKGNGTLVRDDRLVEATRGRASSSYRAGDPGGIASGALARRDAGSAVRFTEQAREVAAGYAEAQAAANKRAWNLTVPDAEGLSDGRIVIHAADGVGYALNPKTGYLGFLHNNTQIKGAGMDALLDGMIRGGTHLDAYDGFLPATYSAFGWREVARMKFSAEYAPPGWSIKTDGKPDIVFMAYAPDMKVSRAAYTTDWDAAQRKARRIGERGFRAKPPEEFIREQGMTLAQRARPRRLTEADQTELQDLYQERLSLQEERGKGNLFADREEAVQQRIAELESQAQGTPLGATEGVGTPQRRITLLPGARNGTLTFEHEMLHATVQALDERGKTALSKHYAGGNKVPTWTEAQHEAVARAYEAWKRNPRSVPDEVKDAFKRMEEGGYHNTILLDRNQVIQVENTMRDIVEGLRSGDETTMAAAADAAEAIGQESEEALVRILSYNKTDEQIAAIRQKLEDRKNAITNLYRERGIIGPDEEARAYMAHFDMADVFGTPNASPTRMGAATDTVSGRVKPDARVLSKGQNKLVRYQTGEMLQDPTVLYWQLVQRWKIERTLEARDELYAMGEPITEGKAIPEHLQGQEVVFLRNPRATPETIDSVTKAISRLSKEDLLKLQSRSESSGVDLRKFLDESNATDITDAADEMFFDPRTMKSEPTWMQDEANIRVVPRRVAVARVGNVFSSSPTGPAASIWGTLNGLARIALIYAPGGGIRYIGRNYVQNLVLLAVTNPSGFQYVISSAGRALKRDNPKLYSRVLEEVGSYQSTALPEFNTRARTRAQRIERGVTDRSRGAGEALGKFADVPLRVAAYRANAAKWGYETPDDLQRLLDDTSAEGKRIREAVRQQTRDDMIDFDALSPSEKEAMTRFFFIWPFIRGASKWPAMYLREYPGRAATASMLASSQGALETEPEGGYRERYQFALPGGKKSTLAWLSPSGVVEEWLQGAGATATMLSRGKFSLEPLIGTRLAPQYKEIMAMLSGEVPIQDTLLKLSKENVPWAKDVIQLYDTGQGNQDWNDLLQQFIGSQVKPGKSGRKKHEKWIGELEAAAEKYAVKKGSPLTADQLQYIEETKVAYREWATYEDAVKIEHLNEGAGTGLDAYERLKGMEMVAKKYFPNTHQKYLSAAQARGFDSIREFVDSGKDKERDARWVADKLYEDMFGIKAKLTRAAND